MIHELRRHAIAYFLLLIVLVSHVVLFMSLWPNTAQQRLVAVSLACTYFLWGVLTHIKTKYITSKIIQEYAFAALLAGGLLVLLTV